MEKLLPQNLEAERGVLGSIIIDPEAIDRVIAFVQAGDFYRDAHRTIYEAVLTLSGQGQSADFITICDELERRNKLENVGGASYITSLINQVPTSGNVEYYGRIVERTSVLRRLISAAGKIAAIAYDEVEVSAALELAEHEIFEISARYLLAQSGDVGMNELMAQYMRLLDERYENRGKIVGVPTGFADLDRLLGGLQRSDLDILAARPGIGKTTCAINMAYNAALKFGHRVGIFSLEMSKEQLAQKFVALDSGVEQQRLRTGRIEDDDWTNLIAAIGRLADLGIRIDDTAGITLVQMRSRARRWVAEYGIELIIVDYLQLVGSDKTRTYENRQVEVSALSQGLKNLARELNIPVLALAQLSRAVEGRQSKVPQLSDLRESGCLTGDTPIYLPDLGTYQPIETLIGQSGFRVLALNGKTWKLEPRVVIRAFATGRKSTYKMVTRLGRTIRATGNHTFLTPNGWERLDQLCSGIRIALPRSLPGPQCQSMTDAQLGLLGHLIGDGCTLQRSGIQYITGDLGLAETVMQLAKTIFGDTITPYIREVKRATDKNVRYYVFLSSTQHLTHGKRNPIAAWLDSMGAFNLRSYEKHVPNEVFMQSTSGITCFLRHLWSTDGCINMSHGAKHYASVFYASCSSQLAYDVQSLLLRLGINATISIHPQVNKGRDQYHVSVSGKAEILHFLQVVGGLGEKKVLHQTEIIRHMSQRTANTKSRCHLVSNVA